jgi:hypothetical protein
MRVIGVRAYATAMAATGMPYGQTVLPEFRQMYRAKHGAPKWRPLVIRLLTVAEIGLTLCHFRADRRRAAQNRIAAASRKRNRQ